MVVILFWMTQLSSSFSCFPSILIKHYCRLQRCLCYYLLWTVIRGSERIYKFFDTLQNVVHMCIFQKRGLMAFRRLSEGPTVILPAVSIHFHFLLQLPPTFLLPSSLLPFYYFSLNFPKKKKEKKNGGFVWPALLRVSSLC